MLRLFVVIVCYTLAVMSLPRFAPFAALMETLARLPAKTALIINISALLSASALLYALAKQPGGLLYRRPSALLFILRMGLVGTVFAALYELFQALSNYAISVQSLLLIPPAFMIAEAVYFCGIWVWRRIKKIPGPMFASSPDKQAQPADTNGVVPRLLITAPAYLFILVYLPQQQDFRNFEAQLVNINPSITLAISVFALVVAGGIGWKITRQSAALQRPEGDTKPAKQKASHMREVKASMILSVCAGLDFAALLNLISYFLSYGLSLSMLALIPLGFVFAEALYQGINWRVKYGPPEG